MGGRPNELTGRIFDNLRNTGAVMEGGNSPLLMAYGFDLYKDKTNQDCLHAF
jgi:hypothetical protein